MTIQMSYEEAFNKLTACTDVQITKTEDVANGKKITLSNGGVVICYHSGACVPQGKNPDKIRAILESDLGPKNRKIFVVYGHDTATRDALELTLRRLEFEPIILDREASNGQTIIEKLETYAKEVDYAVVLATPDDRGRAQGELNEKPRARQNVVLELGMFLAKLGRKRVAILIKEENDFEKPSDISGLIYIPFTGTLDYNAKLRLAQELNNAGYKVDYQKL